MDLAHRLSVSCQSLQQLELFKQLFMGILSLSIEARLFSHYKGY